MILREDIFQHLTKEYYRLTAAEKKLADFITANGNKAQSLRISEMADACGVAEATISRFCRRMGYSSFSSLRLSIAAATASRVSGDPLSGEIGKDDSVTEISAKLANIGIDAIHETQELIDETAILTAADILLKSDTVLCMGQGGSMLMAEEAAHLFSTVFPRVFPVSDAHRQVTAAINLTKNDAILFFSYSGATREMMDVLRAAKKRGVTTILITRYPGSPGAALADVILQCGSSENPLQLGSVAARIAQLYLIDVLFSEMCHRDLDGCRRHREQIADELSIMHV